MKLTDLNPEWLHGGGEGITHGPTGEPVPRYTAGVEFDCPCGCGKRRAITWRNPPEPNIPGAGRADRGWTRTGTTFEDLTLSPSIWAKRDAARPDNCDWHGYLENGRLRTV